MAKATVNLFLDKRASKDGEGVIKWLICIDRKQRLFSTGQKVNTDEWVFLQANRSKIDNRIKDEDRRALWQRIYGDQFTDAGGHRHDGYLKRAQSIVDALGQTFTFDAFAEALTGWEKKEQKPAEQTDLLAALFTKGETMRSANRYGNALNYELAAKSLRRFVDSFSDEERKEFLNIPMPRRTGQPRPAMTLRFEHLTPNFLTAYEQWMQHCGKLPKKADGQATGASLTTVGIYLRHVRAVVNEAMEKGLIPREAYPFGRNRYTIPAGANVKKALPKSAIEQIKAYKPIPGTSEQRSQDLWLFSYFCNGANLTDICRITWGRVDLRSGLLTFVRQKTALTKKHKQEPVVVRLRPEAIAIIERQGNVDRASTSYLFPFLKNEMSEEEKRRRVRQLVKVTNEWMKRIAEALGIEEDVNTYSARHSFATTLLKSNAPLAFISKSLGHTNIKTTESYLGSFDDEEAKAFLSVL